MIRSWTVSYLCPSDGVLQSRELGNQFGGLVLLTYRSILQFKKSHTEIRRSSAHLSRRTANFKRWTHEIRSSVAFEPGVGRCCGWNRSCKPTVWRGSRPEQELVLDFSVFILKLTCFILKFQKKRKKFTWHMGLRTALQVCLAQVTGSYWIGGKSGRSFKKGVKMELWREQIKHL